MTDDAGNVVRRITGPADAGFHRVAWDLRYPPADPASTEPFSYKDDDVFSSPPVGPMVSPGTYKVSVAARVDGHLTPVGEPQAFQAAPLGTASMPAPDHAAALQFEQKTARLQRAVLGASEAARELRKQLTLISRAVEDSPRADAALAADVRRIENRVRDLQVALDGDAGRAALQRADARLDCRTGAGDRGRALDGDVRPDGDTQAFLSGRGRDVRAGARAASCDRRGGHEGTQRPAGSGGCAVDAGPGPTMGAREMTADADDYFPTTCFRTLSTFRWKTRSGSALGAFVVKLYCLPPRFFSFRFLSR